MKAIFVFTVVAVFSLGVPVAFAADEHRDTQHGGNSQGQARPQDQGRQQSQPRAQEQSRPQAQPKAQFQARPQSQPRSQAQVAPQRQQRNQPSQVMAAPANNAARSIASQNQARSSGSIRGARTNADNHAYQRNVSAPRHFQAGSYRAPQGYSYQRWSWGQRLPAIYFGRDYWINDYSSYGLFAPPYGLVWVRFGPDALLIDEYSGEIVQVDYGVFY
jgi:Ni/Co efflux regulator RcnB